jgi:hypothetical protein
VSGLDTNTAKFVVGVSSATGIDPRVIIAWVQQEGAYAKGGTGHFNYLNLRPQAGDKYSGVSPGNFEEYSSVNDAIFSTVRRINSGKVIKTTAQAKPTPREQIKAISSSGWDIDSYGGNGGKKLLDTFTGIFGNKGLDDAYVSPASAGAIASTAGTGSAADAGSYDANNAVSDAANLPGIKQILSIGDLIGWIGGNWDRMLLVGGGVILAILGILFIAKNQTAAVKPSFGKG